LWKISDRLLYQIEILQIPSIAIHLMKKIMLSYFNDTILDLENEGHHFEFKTHNFRESMRFFSEKRESVFSGKDNKAI